MKSFSMNNFAKLHLVSSPSGTFKIFTKMFCIKSILDIIASIDPIPATTMMPAAIPRTAPNNLLTQPRTGTLLMFLVAFLITAKMINKIIANAKKAIAEQANKAMEFATY